MDQKEQKPMTPFDRRVTPEELYMLKLLLPYTPPFIQRFLGIFIKFMEFRYTWNYFQGFSISSSENVLQELKPYMRKEDQETMEQMESMMQMMDMMQSMQTSSENPQDIFSMFGTMFDSDSPSDSEPPQNHDAKET